MKTAIYFCWRIITLRVTFSFPVSLWMAVKFSQMIFLHLIRWSWNLTPFIYSCDRIQLILTINFSIKTAAVVSFSYIVGLGLSYRFGFCISVHKRGWLAIFFLGLSLSGSVLQAHADYICGVFFYDWSGLCKRHLILEYLIELLVISLDWCFFGGKSLIKIWQWLWDRLGLLILFESLVFSSPLCAKVQEGPLFLVSSQSRLSPSDLGFTCRDVFCHSPTLSKPWLVRWLHSPQAAGPKV